MLTTEIEPVPLTAVVASAAPVTVMPVTNTGAALLASNSAVTDTAYTGMVNVYGPVPDSVATAVPL